MVAPRVRIDPLSCAGTGYCVEVAPEVFGLAGTGPAAVLQAQPPPGLLEAVREAETLCPTNAIRIDVAPQAGPED
jgi:ferredoxin